MRRLRRDRPRSSRRIGLATRAGGLAGLLMVLAQVGCGGGSISTQSTGLAAGPHTVNDSVPVPTQGGGGTSQTPLVTTPSSVGVPSSTAKTSNPGEQAQLPGSGGVTGTPTTIASYTFRRGRIDPSIRSVATGNNVKVIFLSADGRSHSAMLRVAGGYPLVARPGVPGSVTLAGLQPGLYALTAEASTARLAIVSPAQAH